MLSSCFVLIGCSKELMTILTRRYILLSVSRLLLLTDIITNHVHTSTDAISVAACVLYRLETGCTLLQYNGEEYAPTVNLVN